MEVSPFFRRCFGFILLSFYLSFFIPLSGAQESKLVIRPQGLHKNGWFVLGIESPGPNGYLVEKSDSLNSWSPTAVILGSTTYSNPILPFVDAGSGSDRTRFYRVQSFTPGASNDWKNAVFYPEDNFLSERTRWDLPETRWLKFTTLKSEPDRVYFQDSVKYRFHYDFAVARLPQFKGMSPEQFDQVSLHTNGQQVVLGTLLYSPKPEDREVGIQFVGMDVYPIEESIRWLEIVSSAILSMGPVKTIYIPSYEQSGFAESNREAFAARGFEVASIARWDTGENAYSYGWAIGKLKYVPTASIDQAYATGELKPEDILLTDAVPAEIPYVSGILTLNPATPNSHVAILARSYGVPFAWLASPALRATAQALTGKDVIVSAMKGFPVSDIRIIELGNLEPALRQEIADLKNPQPVEITPKARYGAYTASIQNLVPADIKYFGGKAANYGFLRRQLPANSPAAIAISFDLWDDFMSQVIFTGKTLREEIQTRMAKYSYPPNVGELKADLQFIRNLITDSTQFTEIQQDQIASALLGNFDPQKNIRFRSSTNVEDSESFTGAGLYDSYSGCLADDLDNNTSGPSICDPTESKERGVYRAIRKVYASFYNDNAVLERLRHRIDESTVGMAILVHYSNPDPEEMANGVATVAYTRTEASRTYEATMTTQKGAVSVTNPDNSAIPEVVGVSKWDSPYASTRQWSSLVPLGANVLEFDAEYVSFCEMFEEVAKAFEAYYPAKQKYILDFEYKKIVPGQLIVKQVREIPNPASAGPITPYLLDQPGEWTVFQGEFSHVFANHRLKSAFQLSTRNMKMSDSNLNAPILNPISFTYPDGDQIKTMQGSVSSFPGAVHKIGEANHLGLPVSDSWDVPLEGGPRTVSLTAYVQNSVPATETPIFQLGDFELEFSARYSTPQIGYNSLGELGTVTEDAVRLFRNPGKKATSIPVTRNVPLNAVTNMTISFFWPERPSGVTVGYTAPLAGWDQTRIEGFTSQPIVLRGYYSQTYRPGHHNFVEEFIFEPRLESGLDPSLLAELEAKDIRQIYVFWGGADYASKVALIGRDGSLRYIGMPEKP